MRSLLGGCEFVHERNKLATEREAINGEWSQVDADLQRRADLIPNLVETVKGYAKEETTVIQSVANARAALVGARSPQEKIDANNQLTGRFRRLAGGGRKLSEPEGEREFQAAAV